jgi:hypothetical protein
MIRHTLLALALIGVAGVANAQTNVVPMPGHVIVASPPQASPGDYTREAPGLQPPDQQAQMTSPYQGRCGHQEAMRDEYGFRYDSQGHRINAQGCAISPHAITP